MPPGVVDGSVGTRVGRGDGRQMGCMAGFLHMFDRSQFLGGRRVSSRKRLPCITSGPTSAALNTSCSSSPMGTLQEEDMVVDAGRQVPPPENIKEPVVVACRDRPRSSFDIRDVVRDSVFRDVAKSPEKQPAVTKENQEEPKAIGMKDGLRSSWRPREAPRLSLDSRAAMRSSGGLFPREIRTRLIQPDGSADEPEDVDRQRRSPSVVARLMGLDVMPDFDAGGGGGGEDGFSPVELRRSASESRVSREFLGWSADRETPLRRQRQTGAERSEHIARDVAAAPAKEPRRFQQSKGFESAEVFPDARRSGNLYGEIERRLKLRGINDPGRDLETLKQILEALQFKGLLHSIKSGARYCQERRNFVFDERKPVNAETAVVTVRPFAAVRPSSPSPPRSVHRSYGTESSTRLKDANNRIPAPGRKQTVTEPLPPSNTRKNRSAPAVDELGLRNVRTSPSMPPRNPGRGRDSERNSPRQTRSPPRAATARRAAPESSSARSPGHRKQVERDLFPAESPAKEYRPSTFSKNRRSTPSPINSERSRTHKKDECAERRILLDRCDKEAMEQPSPVSVLDAPFRNEDSSLSPVTKRSIDFADDHLFDNDDLSVLQSKESLLSAFTEDEIRDVDSDDFRYVSDIVLASEILLQSRTGKGSAAVFSLLESRRRPGPGDSDHRRVHRRLVFDTVMEILQRKRQQRGEAYVVGRTLLRQIWTEFRRIQRLLPVEDLCDMVTGVIRKDLYGAPAVDGWTAECPAGTADAVLDIERLIFKDLVVDTIRQLAFLTERKAELARPTPN
ncbi:LONGIFOLIA 1 protein [Nymphaea thermarum]|nr:LONGIFOLIA 1 protein [Nymphaea thermarum]